MTTAWAWPSSALALERFPGLQPSAFRNPADADPVRIHETGTALDVLRAPVEPGNFQRHVRESGLFAPAAGQGRRMERGRPASLWIVKEPARDSTP